MGVTDCSLISRLPENKVYILANWWYGGTELCFISFCPSASRCACPLSHFNPYSPCPSSMQSITTHTHTMLVSLYYSGHLPTSVVYSEFSYWHTKPNQLMKYHIWLMSRKRPDQSYHRLLDIHGFITDSFNA